MKKRRKFKQSIINSVEIISKVVFTKRVIKIIRKLAVFFALIFFLIFLVLVYADKNDLFSIWPKGIWPSKIPRDYFFSVYLAFTFILFYEVLAMIYAIPRSISTSIGKQYEIMSLIILRSVFEHVGEYRHFVKEFEGASSLLSSSYNWHALGDLMAGCFGSLLLFFLIRIFYTIRRNTEVYNDPTDFEGFVAIKKMLSLGLVIVFLFLAIFELSMLCEAFYSGNIEKIAINHVFFKDMFSIMIFVDIMFVLVTTRYTSNYHVVYRNSGLAISTVVLRLSFSSSIVVSVVMAMFAVLIGIGVTLVYNQFQKEVSDQ